ncbi:MAG: hypothetical protein RIB58_08945 [Phycisphaerales bacterium]
MPGVAYSLVACNLKLAKGRSYKAQILPKGRGLLIQDGAPGARSGLRLFFVLAIAIMLTLFGLGWWYAPGYISAEVIFWLVVILVVSIACIVTVSRMPAEARKVLLDCRRRRAEFRVDEGVVDEAFLRKTQEIEIVCTNDLFRIEPVDVGLGMYAVVIDLNGYPFAVATSRSAEEMIQYADILREKLHDSMTG